MLSFDWFNLMHLQRLNVVMFINHLFLFSGVLCFCSPSGEILLSFAPSNVNCISAHPAYRIWRCFTTRDISTHLLVLVNAFHKGRDPPPSVFCTTHSDSLIPIAYCFLLWPGALWELNRVHLVEGPSPESASCMNRYFNFHSLLSADLHSITIPCMAFS